MNVFLKGMLNSDGHPKPEKKVWYVYMIVHSVFTASLFSNARKRKKVSEQSERESRSTVDGGGERAKHKPFSSVFI